MPRGGRRKGQPGKAYPQRSDMRAQGVKVAPGQPYGAAQEQAEAQQAIPLPQQPNPGTMGGGGGQPMVNPAAGLPGLTDPSSRPNEPLTTGLPIGAGAGPEVLHGMQQPNPVDELRAVLLEEPWNDELRELIELADEG